MLSALLLCWTLVSPAHAEDPPPAPPTPVAAEEPPAPTAETAPAETIWVFEDGAVKKAREEVGIALRDLGYHRERVKDGRDIYVNESPWKPWVVVDDDGWMMVKRAPVSFSKPPLPGVWNGPLGYLVCVVQPTACVHVGGLIVSKRKLNAQKVDVLERVEPEMDRYEAAVLERAMKERTDITLPDALDALWASGRPFHGEGTLATYEERRGEVLNFWLTRLDDPYGDRVREVVEVWSRNTIQTSEHPFTEAEIELGRRRAKVERSIEGLFFEP